MVMRSYCGGFEVVVGCVVVIRLGRGLVNRYACGLYVKCHIRDVGCGRESTSSGGRLFSRIMESMWILWRNLVAFSVDLGGVRRPGTPRVIFLANQISAYILHKYVC